MYIIVLGTGKVGFRVAKQLVQESHDVVIVDIDPQKLKPAQEVLDVMAIRGNGAAPKVLEQAGIKIANMVIAVTGRDEVNILACLTAKHYGVPTTVARVRNPEYSIGYQALVKNRPGVDIMIHPERLAAREIVDLLSMPAATEVHRFVDGTVDVLGFKLNSSTPALCGKTLETLNLKHCLIVAVDRDGDLLIPDGKTRLEPGDHIYVLENSQSLKKDSMVSNILTKHIQAKTKRIVIVGGGEKGFHTCQTLEAMRINGLSLKLIEKDMNRARWLAENLSHTLVIQGDGTNPDLLGDENIKNVDAFVAATSCDETNIMAALLANRLGVKETIITLEREEYGPIADAIGVGATVVPRLIVAGTILKLLQKDKLLDIAFLKQGRATVLEAKISKYAPITRKPLKSVNFPKHALIGVLVRNNETIIPSGHDQIMPGDKVVAFALQKSIPGVRKALGL